MATTSAGKCKIDGVEVGEVNISIFGQAPGLSATYAYTIGADRVGKCSRNTAWSDSTLKAVNALLAAIEQDICSDVFAGDSTGSVDTTVESTVDSVESL